MLRTLLSGKTAWVAYWLLLGAILSLAIDVVLYKLAGTHAVGFFNYSFSIVQIIAGFGVLGVDWLAVRDIPKRLHAGNFSSGYILKLLAITLFGAIFVAGFGTAIFVLYHDEFTFALLLSISAILLALIFAIDGILRGLSHSSAAMFTRQASFRIIIVIGLLFTPLTAVELDNIAILWILLGSLLVSFVIGLLLMRLRMQSRMRKLNAMPRQEESTESDVKGVLAAALLASGLGICLKRFDILMLEPYVSAHELGVYTLIQKIALNAVLLNLIIVYVKGPELSRLIAEDKTIVFAQQLRLANKQTFLLTSFCALMIMAAIPVIAWVYEINTSEFIAPLLILLVSVIIESKLGLVGNACVLIQKHWHLAGALAGALAFGLISACLLVPAYGLIGAACSFLISNICFRLWCWFVVRSFCVP